MQQASSEQEDFFPADTSFNIPLESRGRRGSTGISTIDSSDCMSQSTDGTPNSLDQFGIASRKNSLGASTATEGTERKKEKKSKKEKKAKKDKKKKKKHKSSSRATEKLLDGDMENAFDGNFDDFITKNREPAVIAAAPDEAHTRWLAQQEANQAWAMANGFHPNFPGPKQQEDFHQTPKTQSTSTTMSSRGSLSDNFASSMLDALPTSGHAKSVTSARSRNSADSGSNRSSASSQKSLFKGDVLQSFLTHNGQDEKLALETAMAFESFLLEQQGNGIAIGPSSRENSESGSNQTGQDTEYSESDEEEDDCMEIDTHDDSDVSTLGWSCAEETTFGSSWSDGTFMSAAKSSAMSSKMQPSENGEDDFGMVRKNEKFVGGKSNSVNPNDFSGGGRRVPNRVAATQGRTMQLSMSQSVSERFANERREERSFEEQMASLTINERGVVTSLKARWIKSGRPPFPNMWYLKFARCSPGQPFTFKTAYKSMRKYNQYYMNLTIVMMEQQLLHKMLFPIPGLRSIQGHSMFYMRPARYFPKKMSTTSVINNLIYVMDCMLEREEAQRDGIGFVANMEGWTMSNFQVNYCYKFMMGLQAKKSPTRVELFLIVNPPGWFGNIWSIMKPMLSEEFRKKVHMINYDGMKKYLNPGYEAFLPDDMLYGKKDTAKIVKDFIVERRQLESSRMLSSASIH